MLYYNKESITELPRSNVFIVTANNKLVTPAHNILYGITRKNIIELAAEIMPVEERNISVEELLNASEVFLTATTKKIIPIVRINGQPIANAKPGPVTTKLFEKFLQLETQLTHLVSR